MQIESPQPLTILVGKACTPVLFSSVIVRRIVRDVALACTAFHPDRRPATRVVEAEKLQRQRTYQRALLYVLALPLFGQCSTEHLLNCLIKRKNAEEDSVVPWDAVLDQHRAMSPQSKSDVRLKRIAMCAEQCHDTPMMDGVQEFEATVELQARLMQINQKGAATVQSIHLNDHDRQTQSMVRTPIPWCETDPPLVFGRNGAFFGYSEIHPRDLTHVLALGGTGVGKTESVTKPAVAAALAYQLGDGTKSAVLIIDPKAELIDKVKSVLAARGEMVRLHIVGQQPPTKMFTVDCKLSQSDRYQKLLAYVPSRSASSQNAYWHQLSEAAIRDFMQLEELYAKKTGNQRLMATLARELKLPTASKGGFWHALRDVLAHSCTGPQKLKSTSELLRRYCKAAGIASSSMQVMQSYTGATDLIEQWTYLVMSAQPTIAALANPDLERFVDLDILGPSDHVHTDVAELVEAGKVVLFCPEPKAAHDIAGKALKEKFYEASLARENLRMGVFIVIDEFHRFVTDDVKSQSSEASFIDVCRAFRVNVFFATQALGSIKRALGSDVAAQNAVDVICQNTPTKAVFRCSDADTVSWLKTQIPHPADGSPHVIAVRPPSGLEPGEAYNLWADGTWGRQRARLTDLA